VLRVSGLSKTYRRKGAGWQRSEVIVAAQDVAIEIFAGQTLALVGRSDRVSPRWRLRDAARKAELRPDLARRTDIAQLDSRNCDHFDLSSDGVSGCGYSMNPASRLRRLLRSRY